ncbi:hypothetical protein LC087_03170 [Bacillus carboniphilus]|uniref:Uncharacterized protein n=1 Tax=Bacillus carboniphilus TaxID=86663 RepID=A0ABY9JUZ9_9BACI|nr:hypothetical protein [Bacillus carboniphilus]WLR43212.1 hypothetical protein LC087_03170 [Bacillus carboniphilus]
MEVKGIITKANSNFCANSSNVAELENVLNNTFERNQLIRVGTLDGSFTEGRFKYAKNSVIALRQPGKDTNTIIFLVLGWCYGPA